MSYWKGREGKERGGGGGERKKWANTYLTLLEQLPQSLDKVAIIRGIVGNPNSADNIKLENLQRKWILVFGPEPPLKLSVGTHVQNNLGGTSIRNVESNAATCAVLCPRTQASNVQFISHICCLCFIWEPILEWHINWHCLQISICSMLQHQNTPVYVLTQCSNTSFLQYH